MAALTRRASSQLLSSRSVHLRIQPRPANLSESREILRVLQRFGEISVYKHLRYEYHNPADNIALAIYRDAGGAQQALNASPVRFALERIVDDTGATGEPQRDAAFTEDDAVTPQTPPLSEGIDEIHRPSQLLARSPNSTTSQTNPHPANPTGPLPYEPATAPPKTTTKWFQVTVDRSRVIHQDFVERQPYWKQFTPMKSMAQEDLSKAVPHVGLSDVSKRPPNHHRTPNKVLKQMSYYVEHRMPSLRDMYEDGGREKHDRAGR